MKKGLLLCYFIITYLGLSAQLLITGKYVKLAKQNGVTVIIFDSISSDTKIDYNGINPKFYKYNTLTATYLLPPDDATGYLIENNGTITDTIFVIDYHNYKPKITQCELAQINDSPCDELTININQASEELNYYTPNGTKFSIPREFSLKYNSKTWRNEKWVDTTIVYNPLLKFPSQLTIEAPLCDTQFTLSGDQIGILLNKADSLKSSLYNAIAVKCFPTSITTIRNPDATNEEDGPTDTKQVKGSAPMEILFLSNANEPVAKFYRWEVYKNNQLQITRSDKDHRYSFTEYGTYKIKVISSSNLCSATDSIIVEISDSQLQIPNVFTPNGDGLNDQFRVGYKSIVEFNAWIYNRWGRKIYYWSDPTKGWDGRIGGKDASPGPYFYVIKAVGADGKKYLRKGDINLLR